MTDPHDLIHRLADELDHYRQLLTDDRTERHPLATEARAALAELQGEGPTQRQVLQLASQFWPEGAEPLQAVPFARAVLARFGRPAPLPADDLLQSYQAGRRDAEADERWAADVAQDLPADGEVGELIRELRDAAFDLNGSDPDRTMLTRAADLLARLALQPVLVSERLPGAEDCVAWERNHPISDAWCWWWDNNESAWVRDEADTPRPSYLTHWLPAHALPVPREEAE